MVRFLTDFHGFADRYSNILSTLNLDIEISIVDENDPLAQICAINNTPFSCNPISRIRGTYVIAFNQDIIDCLELTGL